MNRTEGPSHHEETLLMWAAMGGEPVPSTHTDRDRRRRFRFIAVEAVCRLGLAGGTRDDWFDVEVQNVSAGGVCLLSTRSLPICQRVTLHPPRDAPEGMDAVAGHVTYCTKPDEYYRIGLNFYGTS